MKATALIFAFAAAIAITNAACPNQCSGHGRCGENDKCVCYQQTNTPWGQRRGYTGADCSRRTCPLGIAFDKISTQSDRIVDMTLKPTSGSTFTLTGFEVFIDKNYYKTEADRTYTVRFTGSASLVYKRDDQDYFSPPIDFTDVDTEGEAILLTRSDMGTDEDYLYFYVTGTPANGDVLTFTILHNDGVRFDSANHNSAHQYQECSGRGMCNSVTGRCQCFTGYTGEACQRTTCPNDCSGHGICQSQSRFISEYTDKSYTYSVAKFGSSHNNQGAYDSDKQFGCRCDYGFRGPDCSLIECPSGPDPLNPNNEADANGITNEGYDCSNRGVCDYATGTCKCFKGYFGERCETQTNYI